MPRPGKMDRIEEKPKNFFGSLHKLFNNLRKWRVILVIALLLATISSVFSIIAPNQLSKLTDEITLGIKPDIDKLKEINSLIMNNQNHEALVIDGVTISIEEQVEYINVIKDVDYTNQESMISALDKLPTNIYNLIKPKMNIDNIRRIAIFLVTIYIIGAILYYLQGFITATMSNDYAKTLRSNISYKINQLPLSFFDKHETGDILSRITNDVDTIAMNLNQTLANLISNITLLIGSLIMMILTNGIMALTAIVSSLFGILFMFIVLSKSQKYFNKRQEILGDLNGYIEEIYSGHTIVKTYNGVDKSKKEFSEINKDLYTSNMMSQFLSGLMGPFMGFIANFGYVCVCVVGAVLVSNGSISFGVIIAFMVYIRLFSSPLNQIAQAMTSMQSTAAAAERVFDFLEEEEMSYQGDIVKHLDKSKVKGEIVFDHVKFGYDKGKTIIKDFSASIKPGEKVAIVGPTGAGKTTMVNLLMKFYEINSGDIRIDGISTKELTRENIHDLFCMVLQDTWLFDGSIRDNIRYNKIDVSDDEIMNACKTVGIDHFVKALPGGLNANIGESDSISSGQKQLFTIARGMLEDAPFLILDEATSNVDTRTEELVQKAMDKLTVGRTSFIIAHRLSTIKNADLILVMKDGNIIEKGNHKELMKQKGFYYDLYNSQFEKTI